MFVHKTGAKLAWISCSVVVLLLFFSSISYAEDHAPSVGDLYKNPTSSGADPLQSGTTPIAPNVPNGNGVSGWSFLLQVLFSLALVVLLIYLLLRFLGKRQLGGFNQNGPIKVISAMPLGNGKSVQVVMIGDALYILGVGEDIRLLRHIPSGEEMDMVLSEAEMKNPVNAIGNWLPFLRGKRTDESIAAERTTGSFEDLLEKQWSEVNHDGVHAEKWRNQHGTGKGEDR